MGYLTSKSRIEQTNVRRYWKLIDNELFEDEDGSLYLSPRGMISDGYTIPMWVSWIAGSPVDFDLRCAHTHDVICDFHNALKVNLSTQELKERNILHYYEKKNMWICEDIPVEFLSLVKMSKMEANNALYRAMKAVNVPLLNRLIIRAGTAFNIGWFIDPKRGTVILNPDISKVYEEDFWNFVFHGKMNK